MTSLFSVGGDTNELADAAPDLGLFADGGAAFESPLSRPEGLVLDERNGFLYVADTGNGLVRRIELSTGTIQRIAGSLDAGAPPPTALGAVATEVRLQRPTGLALDPDGLELFIADVEARQVLALELGGPGPHRLRLIETAEVARPAKLAFHRFPDRPVALGQRFLFLLDLGEEVSAPGASVAPPRLHTVNLDRCSGGCFTHFLDVEFGPGLRYRGFRALADIALGSTLAGAARLYVAADVGEQFESYAAGADIPTAGALGFELDCFNGLDDDGDGLEDTRPTSVAPRDDDCGAPVQVQVLLFEFQSDGTSNGRDLLDTVRGFPVVTGFRRFPVDELVLEPPDCPGCIDGNGQNVCADLSPPVDFPGLSVSALALDSRGSLYLVDPLHQQVSFVDGTSARLVPVFGTDFELASPFDGAGPRATRLNRPRAILVDSLQNLIVADTVNNRVRRVWIGDLLP